MAGPPAMGIFMAEQSAGGKDSSTLSPSFAHSSKLPLVLDCAAVVVIFLGLGTFFTLNDSARLFVVEAVGLGVVPITLWTAALLVGLRYWRHAVIYHWRLWAIGAVLVVLSVGALSMFEAPGGVLRDASLGGYWGQYPGGQPMWLAAIKLGAICVLTPPILYPRSVGAVYLKSLHYLAVGLKYAGIYAWAAVTRVANLAGRGVRSVSRRSGEARRKAPDGRRRAKDSYYDDAPEEETASDRAVAEFWAQTDWQDQPQESNDDGQPLPQTVAEMAGEANGGAARPVRAPQSQWSLPSISILSPPVAHEHSRGPLEQMARHVETSLAEHGVHVEVTDIKAGPRIVQFGLAPGWAPRKGNQGKDDGDKPRQESRVKVQSILSREKDLALALKTPSLRIEAPVPGEALVGLEVPAPAPSKVHLREVMENPAFTKILDKGGCPWPWGRTRGATRWPWTWRRCPTCSSRGPRAAAKACASNSIVASLLLTKPPDQLRMLMVDPKRVELTPFNKIPHLVAPVIVEVDEVNPALRAIMREMYRRYKQMEEIGTRNLAGYNAKSPEPMPYLVVIVDELADLMIAGGFEVEQSLVRLAQLGRAAGIHLVLATQRPSVQVVTGLLKANVPGRVAFAVASQVDSRVILDVAGAEKLLGKGDGLLLNSDSPKPRRVQGTLVYDEEIDEMVKFWREQQGPPLPEIPMEEEDEEDPDAGEEIDDRLMEQAREAALKNPHVSPSYMARRFKVGEQKAAQIIHALEEEGLVIPK